jgi:hypothetical protein
VTVVLLPSEGGRRTPETCTQPEDRGLTSSVVFDWIIEPVGSGKYWLVRAGRAQYTTGQTSGIDAVLTLRQGAHPTEEQAGKGLGYVCNIEVTDIDQTLEKDATVPADQPRRR